MNAERAIVFQRDGEVRASSRDVAAAFEKTHKNVLRAIDRMLEVVPDEARRNFAPCSYRNTNGRQFRMFEMTRDGFSALAMGFNGDVALRWKFAFIDAFNKMEAALRAPVPANDRVAITAPNLGSPEEVNSIRAAVTMVRQMQQMRAARRRSRCGRSWVCPNRT